MPARASLPMYDHPAVRDETDRLWAAIAEHLTGAGIEAPAVLDRRADYPSLWRERDLLLSQTCGYPFATRLRGHVRLVATPVYDCAGCDGPLYSSALVVRADDPVPDLAGCAGRIAAFNARDSQSGHNALRHAVAPLAAGGRFFRETVETGGHAASLLAVAEGWADLCAADCVTWAQIARHQPGLGQRLRVLGFTAPAPGLPLITAGTADAKTLAALRHALAAVAADPALADVRAALMLRGFEFLDDAAYDRPLEMEREAIALGYPALA